jgi:molybdenum cofactor guanylyltransferase
MLLGGGASSRMGMPKAMVLVDGEPLWRRQVKVLQGLGPAEILISAGSDWAPEPGPWTILRDRAPGLGPLEGVGAALASMTTDLLLVLAVDMPSMSTAYLQGLVDAAGQKGVVPERDGTYQGLSAVYPRACAAVADQVLASADRSIQFFVKRLLREGFAEVKPVSDAEQDLFRNVNRPGDL